MESTTNNRRKHMKKALILGTNSGQADIINYLNDCGWETHACGYKEEGPGCELADHFHLVNIVDEEKVKKLAKNLEVDLVYSVSSDIAITVATKVSEDLGLPTLLNSQIIDLFNNKDEFRTFLNKHDIGAVRFIKVTSVDDLTSWKDFPCVVKPVDSQGQRGVHLVKNEKELKQSLQDAIHNSKNKTAIVEEYLDGAEFSTNVIVQNGEVIVNEYSDRIVFDENFFGLPKGHAIPPTHINDEQKNIATKYVLNIVKHLNIKDAVLYIQMKLKNNEPRIIEIAPRLDGCHIWRLIKYKKGFDLREYSIKVCLGEPINHEAQLNNNELGVLEFYHLPTSEVFNKNKLELKNKKLAYQEFRYADGDKIVPINGKLEVVGYCVFDK